MSSSFGEPLALQNQNSPHNVNLTALANANARAATAVSAVSAVSATPYLRRGVGLGGDVTIARLDLAIYNLDRTIILLEAAI